MKFKSNIKIGMETFKRIPDFPDYYVSKSGRVASTKGKDVPVILKGSSVRGYRCVTIKNNSGTFLRKVHQLVLEAYVGRRPSHCHGCRHLNGNKKDNRLENLKWGTAKENAADAFRLGERGFGEEANTSKMRECDVVEIFRHYSEGFSQREISEKVKITQAMVGCILRRKNWAHVKLPEELENMVSSRISIRRDQYRPDINANGPEVSVCVNCGKKRRYIPTENRCRSCKKRGMITSISHSK